jgi:hypothetical protein
VVEICKSAGFDERDRAAGAELLALIEDIDAHAAERSTLVKPGRDHARNAGGQPAQKTNVQRGGASTLGRGTGHRDARGGNNPAVGAPERPVQLTSKFEAPRPVRGPFGLTRKKLQKLHFVSFFRLRRSCVVYLGSRYYVSDPRMSTVEESATVTTLTTKIPVEEGYFEVPDSSDQPPHLPGS